MDWLTKRRMEKLQRQLACGYEAGGRRVSRAFCKNFLSGLAEKGGHVWAYTLMRMDCGIFGLKKPEEVIELFS